MAIDQGTETVVVTTQERTWRINIETAMGADPVVSVYRETVKTDYDGTVVSKDRAPDVLPRNFSAVAKQSFTVGGKTYGMAEIAGVIAFIADTWRQEDIAAAAKAAG